VATHLQILPRTHIFVDRVSILDFLNTEFGISIIIQIGGFPSFD